MDELITINQYKKRFHIGDIKVKKMINEGELKTRGKKIVVSKDYIPIEEYKKIYEERDFYKNQLETIKRLLNL